MDYSAYEFLKIEIAERVATVTINRPNHLNAVNAALHHEFEQIWLDLAEDRDVNAILLTGAGKAFFDWRRHHQPRQTDQEQEPRRTPYRDG